MKTGDPLDVCASPVGSSDWVRCTIELVSTNSKSLALSAEKGPSLLAINFIDARTGVEDLVTHGRSLGLSTDDELPVGDIGALSGKRMLFLVDFGEGYYRCIKTGERFEVKQVAP